MTASVVREVPLPANWYLGMHGDPIAQFDSIILRLHEDGTVTWLDASGRERNGSERGVA